MVIDANVHITEDGRWFSSTLDASLSALLSQMDESKIDKSVIIPFAGFISNEYIRKAYNSHPDRLIPASSINPASYVTTAEAAAGFMEAVKNYPFKIIKFHNRLHHYAPMDERMLSILEANNKLSVPRIIMICGLFHSKNVPAFPLTPPQIVEQYASRYPATTFVIMHAAGSYALSVAETIRDYPNVYLDLSYVVTKYKTSSVWFDLKHLVSTFDRRLIWGSDFPEVPVSVALNNFNELAADIGAEKRSNILSQNLLNILAAHERS